MTAIPAPLAAVLRADRLIHEPVRLCILALLANVSSADFVYLQRTLGQTGGNLSTHMSKLADAGLISVEKGYAENRPRTTVSLTAKGRAELRSHAATLVSLLGPIA
ncbi:transcriptional regulator [Maricaulis sp.]|jgi:DNA-binding MarR family transcriptional regulator|uniref:transcriptional regulator n=1 Tax=Maricaulis sp. TaxID=1486257 RepID=UPI00261FCB70|nr:transcriptional regulator [Maricaulis sp.]MDF1769177.1 transcriptional regulator [Maricaulis sp.]